MSDVSTQRPEPRKPGMRGWVKAVFALSLTLNFLALGVVAGGVIGHVRHLPSSQSAEREGGDPFSLGPLSGAFSREDRAEMRRAAEGQGTDFGALRGAILASIAQMDTALRAEPFDEAGMRAVLADMRARTDRRIDLGERVMLARLRAMTPEERAAFAKRLREGYARFERRMGGPEGHR